MSDFECNLVSDLLPVYLDGKASEETKKLITNHIESCSECKEMYDAMSADVSVSKEPKGQSRKKMRPLVKVIIGVICYGIIMSVLLTIFTLLLVEGV